MRYSDTKSAGRSEVIPFKPGEGFRKRHFRRLLTNLELQEVFSNWCADRGLILSVTNEGHHWRIRGTDFFAEWWPSSAKLVFSKKYDKGIHCHDVEQLATMVSQRIGK